MSYRAMDLVYDMQVTDPVAKFVLLTIAKHADERMQCFPSMDRLASLTGLSPRTVQRKVTALRKDGFLSVSNRSIGGKRISNYYTILRPVSTGQSVVELRQPVHLAPTESPDKAETACPTNISDNISTNISSEKNETKNSEDASSDKFWSGFLS
jgi:biotin operon repressor